MNILPRSVAAALCLGLLASGARAEDYTERWGVGLDAGFASGLGSQAVDDTTGDGGALGLSVLRGLTPHWRVGADYENMGLGQIRFQSGILAATYAYDPDGPWTPVLDFGAGAGRADHLTRGGGGETSLAFKGALGFEYVLAPSLTGSARATLYNSGHTAGSLDHQINATVLSLGLNYWFQLPRTVREFTAAPRFAAPAPVFVPPPAPAAEPAPAPAPAAAPAPAPPAAPARVPKKVSITLDVRFESGKAIVRPEFAGNLADVGTFLQSHPTVTAEIEGHTDDSGPADANTRLSQRRAENVRLYLIGHFRLDGARLTAKGYGPSRPIADNATEEGRARNRRVVAALEAQE
jgi:OOP family OmpA-OmpF porin